MNGYRCIACAMTQAADFAGFVCPACGGNLEITYDYEAIRNRVRAGLVMYSARSLPVSRPDAPFPLRVGRTPLHCGDTPWRIAGAWKCVPQRRDSQPERIDQGPCERCCAATRQGLGAETVAVASTGNAGSSLACLAAALDMRAVVFVPETAPAAKLTQALSFGATVLAVRGNYDDAFDLCLKASE